jgi:hypothetical protein
MLNRLIRRLGINESLKKVVVLMAIMILRVFFNELLYVLGFILMSNGIMGRVLCGVYVFMCLSMRLWMILLSYLLPNIGINENYRLLTLGVMPLLAFFVKVCGSWLVL